MSISIQTKFKIGDKVWVPDNYYGWVPIKNEYEVFNIEIHIDSQNQRVFYTLKDCDGHTQRYPSKMCFSSYDECQQWCSKENK